MRQNSERNEVRSYLLNQLSEAEQETLELRLLSDEEFAEELEIVEDELIDEYLADELSRAERASFEETFLAHPERKRKLEAGQALNRYFGTLSPPEPAPSPIWVFLDKWIRQPLFSSPVRAVVPILVVTLIGLPIWLFWSSQSDLNKGLLALNEAYRQERPVEARVSNLDHAPFITRRGTEPERVNTFERSRAERFLSDAFKESADADSSHALGLFYLLQKDTGKAIEYLEQARKADPNNPQIHADLGAAYLEKANQELGRSDDANAGKGLEDLGRSLEYLKQALEVNPNLLEALFNRALVHEHQGLYQQAEADWRAYLEKDSSSPWAAEAQQRLKSLENKKALGSQHAGDSLEGFMHAFQRRDDEEIWKVYKRNHAAAGNRMTRRLVDDFLSDNPNSKPEEVLQALNYLGQLEIRKAQDKYTSDLARVYASTTPQSKPLLVQARQQMKKGFELVRQSKIDEAMDLLVSARGTFEKLGNVPELLTAEAEMAHGAAVQPDLAKGLEILGRIIPACESKNYRWLLAHSLAHLAQIEWNLNNYSKAFSDSSRSLQLFQELDDTSNVSGILVQLASLHLFLNDNEMSWSYLRRALAVAEVKGLLASDVWGIYIAISLNLHALKLYRAALDYQNEALQLALGMAPPSPLLISRSHQYIGLTYGALRQFDLGVQNVRRAYEQGQPIANERNGRNMMASASLKLGDLYRASGDPSSALAAYEESSRLYETLEFAHYRYAAHKGKFLSYLALNNDAMAENELQIVLHLFDDYREKILGERQETYFFDREQDTYDLAIDFSYSRLADEHRAFNYSELCRARNLRELMHHGAEVAQSDSGLDLQTSKDARSQKVSPLNVNEILAQLPEQVQLVQYAVLEKKLLIWHLTRSGIFSKSVEVDSTVLRDTVETALRQIGQRDEKGAAASLKTLYDFIIEPIREKLDPGKVLCFVPDKALHYVPFSALMSGSSGRYLVQDYRPMTSPSATILIDSTNRARARSSVKEESLLAVGDPTFDRSAKPKLANLPSARQEVKGIASNYLTRRLLIAGQATRRSIMDEIARADVAHFAAHYEIDPRSPLFSQLMLASEPGQRAHSEPSDLNSGDIYRLKLTRTRLVVLSGCSTGIEQQFGGEGPIGFARSFLVAGAPVVVASLWPVDSDATSELMIAFHRFRTAEKLSTTEALMRAQQEIMARENYRHPYYWSGFTAIGGYSEF